MPALDCAVSVLPDLLTTKQLAKTLAVHPETVERWRRTGRGPRFLRLTGGAIRYCAADVVDFLAATVRSNTADPGKH